MKKKKVTGGDRRCGEKLAVARVLQELFLFGFSDIFNSVFFLRKKI